MTTYRIEVEAIDTGDLADMLAEIADRIGPGYTGGPGWRVDIEEGDDLDDEEEDDTPGPAI